MKKTIILTVLFMICLSLMSFRIACFAPINVNANYEAGGQYDYSNDVVPLYYNLLAGNNGSIVRSVNNNNIISYQTMVSGTTQNLNRVRISNNPYQDDAAVVGNNGTVLISDNAGVNWTAKTPVTSANLYGVDHSYYLYAVGDNGTILYASEIITGNLVQRSSGTTRNLKAVTISNLNNQRVIAVGDKGTILRTTNGGINWGNVSIPDTTFNFYDLSQKGIYYNTGDIFVAVGSGGRIYKSTDNGSSWQQKSSGTTNTLRSVYFHTLDSGVAVGDNGTIRCTTNGGETWFAHASLVSPPGRHYRSAAVTNNAFRTFSAISDSMFYFSDGNINFTAINPVSSEIPGEFYLSQNYPNPFNPKTKIRFSLPHSSEGGAKDVKLVIYDIRGKEAETLVNEQLKAGIYEVDFDTSGLSTGVYFYRLDAFDYSDVKKMVLVK